MKFTVWVRTTKELRNRRISFIDKRSPRAPSENFQNQIITMRDRAKTRFVSFPHEFQHRFRAQFFGGGESWSTYHDRTEKQLW